MNLPFKPRPLVVCFLMGVLVLSVIIYSCNDFGLDPDYFALVEGKLRIDGTPPEATDELLLALVKGLSGGLSLKATKTISSRELNLSAATQNIPFEIETEADSLAAFFVIWKEVDKPLSIIENIVGSHCEDGALIPIVLADNDTVVSNISIDVNLKKVNRVAGVSGVIEFNKADWPEDIDNLAFVFADPALLFGGLDICNLLKGMDIRLLPKKPLLARQAIDHMMHS